jgi:signal transduction histidine kinase
MKPPFPQSDSFVQEKEWPNRLLQADMAEAVMHEFNNLFNNLVLQLEILKRTQASEEFTAQAGSLQQKCRQVAALLKKLHHFGESRQPPFRPVDLNQIVREVVGGSRSNVPRQWPAPIVLELAQALPPLPSSAFDLNRLVELLLNHATAMTAQPASVLVRTELQSNRCRLVVADKGPAVPAGEMQKVFEPFTTLRPGGDEWTLAVCKILARRLRGSVRGENLPEGGLAITVEFDLDSAAKPRPG